MTRFLIAGTAALAIVAFAAGSYAVDVTNEDQQTHFVTLIGDGGFAQQHEILAGQTLKGICEKCSVSLDGEESFDVTGDQVAMIKDGKLLVQ